MTSETEAIDNVMSSRFISDQFLQIDTRQGETGTADVYRVPYTRTGVRSDNYTLLDLREDSRVRLTGGPYEGDEGLVLGKNREGHLRIQFYHLVGKTRRPFESVLGSWWIEAAVKGEVDLIPIVNVVE